MRPCCILTWIPPAPLPFLRSQADLSILDQHPQCTAPQASCDFGTVIWREQQSMRTAALQPSGGCGQQKTASPRNICHPAWPCHGLQDMLGFCLAYGYQRTAWFMDTSVVLALSVSCGALKPASEGSLQPPEEGACVLLKMVFEKPENAKVCPKKLKGNQEIHHLF